MRLRIREQTDVVLVLERRLSGRTGQHASVHVVVFPGAGTKIVGLVYFDVWLGWYPLGHSGINDMHETVQPAGTVTLRGIAFIEEANVTHIAILTSTISFAAAGVIVNHVFKDELDVLRYRAVVQDTIGPSFGAVSF